MIHQVAQRRVQVLLRPIDELGRYRIHIGQLCKMVPDIFAPPCSTCALQQLWIATEEIPDDCSQACEKIAFLSSFLILASISATSCLISRAAHQYQRWWSAALRRENNAGFRRH